MTGGEIFLMPWMPEVLAELAQSLPVVALTNGTLFSRRLLSLVELLVELLVGLPIALQISLDRPDPDTNDAMRAPDNFRKLERAAVPVVVPGRPGTAAPASDRARRPDRRLGTRFHGRRRC